MKREYFPIMLLILLLLPGCTNNIITAQSQPTIYITIITKEVTKLNTRVVLLYQTPTPSDMPPWDSTATSTNTRTPSCYDTAHSTIELSDCAWSIMEKTKVELDKLVKLVANEYSSTNREEFIQLELEWETHAKNECDLWWGRLNEYGQYEHGTSAPMMVAICIDGKYKDRIIELQKLYIAL